jgi:type II secretory ATPase GspE/PulE/Tfp pilus assembly ATPase PilB-like protein
VPIPHHILKEPKIDEAVDLLLRDAATSDVTEIFLLPTAKDAVVRVRRDGMVHEWFHQSKESHARFVRHLKTLARLRDDVEYTCQEHALRRVVGNIEIEGQLAVVPVLEGEKAVLRLHSQRPGLAELGLSTAQRAQIERCLKKPSGLLVLAGPRRSGRTTTLYALLESAHALGRQVSLIESVSEAELHGIDQETTDPVSGRTTSALLRAAIARGADVLGLGAVRDESTAALAVSAAEHRLVIVVVEGGTLTKALNRLLELRIEPRALARVLSGVLLQRLARRVCAECRKHVTLSVEEASRAWPRALVQRVFGKNRSQTFVRGAKCAACRYTGDRGQVGLFEWRNLLVPERHPATLVDDGVRKALSGEIAPEEILRLS